MDSHSQIKAGLKLVNECVPEIARPQIFNQRTRKHYEKTTITWDDLISTPTIFPTLVIPMGRDGSLNHAFCIVNDMIFDSTQRHVLQLRREVIDWICGDMGAEDKPWGVYRFIQSSGDLMFKKCRINESLGNGDLAKKNK